MLAVVPSHPLDDPTRRALVTSLCIGPGAAQVQEIDATASRIIVLCATLPAALAMGRRHVAYRGICLRRVVHRGRVQHDAQRQLRGVGLHLVEQVVRATEGDPSAAQRLFVTSSAHDAMEAEQRARLVPFECARLVALGETTPLWVEREDAVR